MHVTLIKRINDNYKTILFKILIQYKIMTFRLSYSDILEKFDKKQWLRLLNRINDIQDVY